MYYVSAASCCSYWYIGAFALTLNNVDFHLVDWVRWISATVHAMALVVCVYCVLYWIQKKNWWSIYSSNFYAETIGMMCFTFLLCTCHVPCLSTVLLPNKQFLLVLRIWFCHFFPCSVLCQWERSWFPKVIWSPWVFFPLCTFALNMFVCYNLETIHTKRCLW